MHHSFYRSISPNYLIINHTHILSTAPFIFLPLFAARNPTKGCLRIGGGFCRHIKKAFIALCSDELKSRKFLEFQDLATIDALRDIDCPSCAYFGTSFAHIRMRMRVP